MGRDGRRQHRVDAGGIAQLAQPLDERLGAQQAGDSRQGLEVIGTGADRGEEHHDQVDGLIVYRLEIDRMLETGEGGGYPVETRKLAMRNRDAIAQPCRAEGLASVDRLENSLERLASLSRDALAKLK